MLCSEWKDSHGFLFFTGPALSWAFFSKEEIIQQLPTYIVTRVDSVSRSPPPPDAAQTLGPRLGAVLGAVLGVCNHSSLAWYVECQPAFKAHLKRNKVLKLAQASEYVHGVWPACIPASHTRASLLTEVCRSVLGASVKPR